MNLSELLALAPIVIGELGKEFFAGLEANHAVNKESQLTACYLLAVRSTSLLLGMGKVLEIATLDSLEVLTRAFLESSDLLMSFRFDDDGARKKIAYWFAGKDDSAWKPDHNKCEEFWRNLGRGESQQGTRWSALSVLSHPTIYATHNSAAYAEAWVKKLHRSDVHQLYVRKIADYLTSINKLTIIGTFDLPRWVQFGIDLQRIPNVEPFRKGCDEIVAPLLIGNQEISLPEGSYRVGSEKTAAKRKPMSTNPSA
jgi:hypothetical protein